MPTPRNDPSGWDGTSRGTRARSEPLRGHWGTEQRREVAPQDTLPLPPLFQLESHHPDTSGKGGPGGPLGWAKLGSRQAWGWGAHGDTAREGAQWPSPGHRLLPHRLPARCWEELGHGHGHGHGHGYGHGCGHGHRHTFGLFCLCTGREGTAAPPTASAPSFVQNAPFWPQNGTRNLVALEGGLACTGSQLGCGTAWHCRGTEHPARRQPGWGAACSPKPTAAHGRRVPEARDRQGSGTRGSPPPLQLGGAISPEHPDSCTGSPSITTAPDLGESPYPAPHSSTAGDPHSPHCTPTPLHTHPPA